MAIITDPEAQKAVSIKLGRRLRAARKAARFTDAEAAAAIGHKGITQLSLAETGERIPPLVSLIKLADLYGVTLDYLVGRIDDPIADPAEANQGIVTRAVAASIEGGFKHVVNVLADRASACIVAHRDDRKELKEAGRIVRELSAAHVRFKELNPDWEDLRGLVAVEKYTAELTSTLQRAASRFDRETKLSLMPDMEDEPISVDASFRQFALQLQV